MPIDDIEKPGKWKPLPDGFIAAVDMAARCASRDESQFVLTCVHFHPERIEATDDVQVIQCPIEMGLEKPTLVRRSSMGHVIGIKAAEFAETENWIHFRGAGAKRTDNIGHTRSIAKFYFTGLDTVIVSSPLAFGPVSARRNKTAKIRARKPREENIHIPGV